MVNSIVDSFGASKKLVHCINSFIIHITLALILLVCPMYDCGRDVRLELKVFICCSAFSHCAQLMVQVSQPSKALASKSNDLNLFFLRESFFFLS